MKIRKIDKKRIMAAIILSVTFLFEGCGTDIIRQEKTAPNVESEENSNDNLPNTNNVEEDAVFYAFYDIDGNGTKELIIAGGEDVLHIFPDMDFGYGTNLSLYENGIIEVYYSYSAMEFRFDFYKIGSDGFTPELVDSFSVVWHLEGEESVRNYFQKGYPNLLLA